MVTAVAESRDEHYMERALFLAERGRGRTTPNPLVGAVVVSEDGIVAGQGAHAEAGGPHAEVVALEAAGARARGATLYCTLEPCCHVGRTGPCTDRIADAGIRRVVAAVGDPNPRVAGGGFAWLRAHGVEVGEGVCGARAARLNQPFFTWVRAHRPMVTLKVVTSLDGFVARREGPVHLSGAAADRFFQRQRAEIDAIAVGAGTILTDDPRLTARGAYRARPLVRVVFDWRGRVPATARVCSTVAAGPVIMIVDAKLHAAHPGYAGALAAVGVDVEPVDRHDLDAALRRLAARGILWLLVEGGPRLHEAFARRGLADRLQHLIAPQMLGAGVPASENGRPFYGLTPVAQRATVLDHDVLLESDVHWLD